jgi:hypothetical protein
MARVDKVALERALNDFASAGLIRSWEARPLNMYLINVIGGEVIRPDARETAMWVQGVLYAVSAEQARVAVTEERALDREGLATSLDYLKSLDFLRSWSLDADDDYELEFNDGTKQTYYARDTGPLIAGFHKGLETGGEAALEGPPVDRESVQTMLDAIQNVDVIKGWRVDEDGDYYVVPVAGDAHWVSGAEIGTWASGVADAYMSIKLGTDAERDQLRAILGDLRAMGLVDGWESPEPGTYLIWPHGESDAIGLSAHQALHWGLGALTASAAASKREGPR